MRREQWAVQSRMDEGQTGCPSHLVDKREVSGEDGGDDGVGRRCLADLSDSCTRLQWHSVRRSTSLRSLPSSSHEVSPSSLASALRSRRLIALAQADSCRNTGSALEYTRLPPPVWSLARSRSPPATNPPHIAMQPLSAAQRMQQAHEAAQQQSSSSPADHVLTEDPFPPFVVAQDPFPPANLAPPVPHTDAPAKAKAASQVDVSDESAFPSLGAPVANGKPKASSSLWGSGAAALRARQAPAAGPGAAAARDLSPAPSGSTRSSTPAAAAPGQQQVASTTLQIPTASISISPPASYAHKGPRGFSNERRETPTTLGEVIKEVTRRVDGVAIDASSSRNLTTFIVKARGAKAEDKVDRARNELLAWLEKKVTEEVQVPKSLRAVIIGAKGASGATLAL